MTLIPGKPEIVYVLKEINKIKQQEHFLEKKGKQHATPRKCFQKVCTRFIIVSILASQSGNFFIPTLKSLKSKVNYL